MAYYDVFNGDADGICALHQLRLAMPVDSELVTGVKRDVALLARVDAVAGDQVTVLDLSAHVNHDALVVLLERGVMVDYFDHHFIGTLPVHPNLHAHIDTSATACTGILVDRHLQGRYRRWAIVAAYGDNLAEQATTLARGIGLDDNQRQRLQALGELIAYNAYGDSPEDLMIHPAELYRVLQPFDDPFAFIDQAPIYRTLATRRDVDAELARSLQPVVEQVGAAIYVLPDEPWARRMRGALANDLANRDPRRAHAVLSPDHDAGYVVSVRAPTSSPAGADKLCRQFDSGGGRVGAAGINHLPHGDLPRFVRAMTAAFQDGASGPPMAQ